MSHLTQMEYAIELLAEDNEFSGVIGVFCDGERVYKKAHGCADRSNARENTVSTRFGLASGTKFFTALAIGQLMEQGKLTLDALALPLVNFEFPTYDSKITIKHLLTHTSGIPDYFEENEIKGIDFFQTAIPWYNLKQPSDYFPIFPKKPMKFAPGSTFSYCNSGYILLAEIVAKLSGLPYKTYVEEHVLGRACMRHSGFYAMDDLPENTALGYLEEGIGNHTNIYHLPIVGGGDGGMFSTLEDMERFWVSVLSGELISNELLKVFLSPHVQTSSQNPNNYYGFGIWLTKVGEYEFNYALIGRDPGVSFHSSHCPSKDTFITVISNTEEGAWPIVNGLNAMELKV